MKGKRYYDKVYDVTNDILKGLSAIRSEAAGKASLAKLRNSAGKNFSETVDVWSIIMADFPDEFLGCGEHVTNAEKAIFTALQLYAIHQQGISIDVSVDPNDRYANIGCHLRELKWKYPVKEEALNRRFNAMISSANFYELSYHLRHMIKLMKSDIATGVNYAKLAEDLYRFASGYEEGIRLSWAREYYRQMKDDKAEKELEADK